MDTNQEELQIKVVFLSLFQGMLKSLRRREAFLLIIFVIIDITIITIAFYLTSVRVRINDKTN